MKLYLVTTKGLGDYYVAAKTFNDAEEILISKLHENQYDFGKIEKIKIITDEIVGGFNNWVSIDIPPKVNGFYLVYSIEKKIWTKALYKMCEFHTIESDIDGYISHWKLIVKPPLTALPISHSPNTTKADCKTTTKNN